MKNRCHLWTALQTKLLQNHINKYDLLPARQIPLHNKGNEVSDEAYLYMIPDMQCIIF